MLILAAVPDRLARRLAALAPDWVQLRVANSWMETTKAVRHTNVEVGVFDPALEGRPEVRQIECIKGLFPSFPILIYTAFTPEIVLVLLQLGKLGVRRVALEWYDDHPSRLADLLLAESQHAVSHKLVQTVAGLLHPCPDELLRAVEALVTQADSVQTVQEFADRANMDRRTCLRWFDRANLPSPSVFLGLVRTLHAHRLLQDPGYTIDDVARKVGYSQTRSFSQNVRQFFDTTPGELRGAFSPEELFEVVKRRYFSRETKRHLEVVS